jgi:dynein heavy chain
MFELIKKSFARYSLNRFFSNNAENLIFSNFASGMNGADRLYDLMPNDKLLQYIDEGLTVYNDNNPVMNLVLFEDAMKHVCRITRIIMPSSGHGLLVGVGGSGKQSLSRLAASMMYMTAFQITISSTYSINDLKTDLQTLYQKTGVK